MIEHYPIDNETVEDRVRAACRLDCRGVPLEELATIYNRTNRYLEWLVQENPEIRYQPLKYELVPEFGIHLIKAPTVEEDTRVFFYGPMEEAVFEKWFTVPIGAIGIQTGGEAFMGDWSNWSGRFAFPFTAFHGVTLPYELGGTRFAAIVSRERILAENEADAVIVRTQLGV